MTSLTPDELIDIGLNHLGRFAFFTRDNPFVSSTAALSLGSSHRETIKRLLEEEENVEDWLSTPSAGRLSRQIAVVCLPRDVQLVTRGDLQRIGVENVHAFLKAPLFWWLVSILWCITTGRRIEPLVGDEVMGYRLHPGFLENPRGSGFMFREHRRSHRMWRDYPRTVAKRFPGEVLATNTLDLLDFYYSVNALPSRIVSRFLEFQEGPKPKAKHARVLTHLLNHLHGCYATQCAAVRPRPALTEASRPLPVGLPSSRILANLIVSLVVDDLASRSQVGAVAAFADDFIVMTHELPRMAEPPEAYFSRLGLLSKPDPPTLDSERAEPIARLVVSLGKSATSYSRSAPEEEGKSEGGTEQGLEDAELDPYIESQPDPDWGGRLRTVLRAPHRRDRVPRELSKDVQRLVDEVRIGLDADEATKRLEKIVTEMDSGLFLALRPFWTELLVTGIAARGSSFAVQLTTHFTSLLENLEPPQDATDEMIDSIHRGLRAAWIHALAQALAVALAQDEMDFLQIKVPRLADTDAMGPLLTSSVVNYAKRIRSRRLIPSSLVSTPLAEFTTWTGRLIGPTAYREFADWARNLTVEQKLSQVTRSIARSVRFVHLHEVCLALHLWIQYTTETDSWLTRAFRLLGRQPLIESEFLAQLQVQAETALAPPSRTLSEALAAVTAPELRFALPSLPISSEQLQAEIDQDASTLGAIASASRSRIRAIVGIATRHKAQVLVLPEWSVLAAQLPWLMGRAGTDFRLTIAGEAPSIRNRTYSNRLWTGIPVEDEVGHTACLVPPPREKRFLSPHELRLLAARRIQGVPASTVTPTYEWQGIRFASLICFEFADIATRTALRHHADLLTVSSFNQDWRYFDAIQEATTRDNYCLTVCVNTGAFPGTRIMRPTKSEMAVAASVHGSDEPAVVSRVIDIRPIISARRHGMGPSEAGSDEPTDDTSLSDYKPYPPS